jgi:hypothetical protein
MSGFIARVYGIDPEDYNTEENVVIHSCQLIHTKTSQSEINVHFQMKLPLSHLSYGIQKSISEIMLLPVFAINIMKI